MDLVNTNEYDEDQSSKLTPGKHRTTKYIRRIGDANWNNQPAYRAIGNQPGNEPVWPARQTNAPTPQPIGPEGASVEHVRNYQIQGYKIPIDPATKQAVTPDDPRYNALMKPNLGTGGHDPRDGVQLMEDVTSLRPFVQQTPRMPAALQNVPFYDRQGSIGNISEPLAKQVMGVFRTTFAAEWPKIARPDMTLDQFDSSFRRIVDAIPGAGGMTDQIKKEFYDKFMPRKARNELDQKLMTDRNELRLQQAKKASGLPESEWNKYFWEADEKGNIRHVPTQEAVTTAATTAETAKETARITAEEKKLAGRMGHLGNENYALLQADEQKAYHEEYKNLKAKRLDAQMNKAKAKFEDRAEWDPIITSLDAEIKESIDTWGWKKNAAKQTGAPGTVPTTPGATPTAPVAPQAHPATAAMIQWAKAHPEDPSSAEILRLNGIR